MSNISIDLLKEFDGEELFKFECENREFFETMLLSRGDSYYNYDNFKNILKDIIDEQEKGLLYMYLIKDDYNRIVGRINLVSIMKGSFNKAELGYRIGKKHIGKGYATKAVGLVLNEAINRYKLHRIEAGTSPDNIGSQIVLIKNGFQFTGRSNQCIYKSGKWCDSINFEKILD